MTRFSLSLILLKPDGDVIVGAEIHRSDESLPSESTAAVSSEPKDVPTEGGDNDMAIQFDFDLKGVTVILYTNEPKLVSLRWYRDSL